MRDERKSFCFTPFSEMGNECLGVYGLLLGEYSAGLLLASA